MRCSGPQFTLERDGLSTRVNPAKGHPKNGMMMTGVPLDELGPVDYVVVEFPAGASNFTGEMASELRRLVDGGIIV